MEAIEKQKVTGVSSTSDATSRWYYPQTKRQALTYKDEGVRISLTSQMAGSLVNFLQSVGADNELPGDHAGQVEWLNHFHTQVAVNNPLWPEDMGFDFVYGHFVNAVMYNRVELRGHNIHAFITAFRDWITQTGVEDRLREKWLQMNPDQRPKQLEAPVSLQDESELDHLIRAKRVCDWPDEMITDQYAKIRGLYGEEALESLGATKYMSSVVKEAKSRGLI